MEYKGYKYSACEKNGRVYIMIRKDNKFIRATRHFLNLADVIQEANQIVDRIISGRPPEKEAYSGLRDWLTI